MRSSFRLLALVPSVLLCLGFLPFSVAPARCQTDTEYAGFYVVNEYDEARDPAVDLKTIRGYPHIFVLEKDGTLLHSQNTGDLEEGKSYNEEALLGFLDDWMPSKGGSR